MEWKRKNRLAGEFQQKTWHCPFIIHLTYSNDMYKQTLSSKINHDGIDLRCLPVYQLVQEGISKSD